MKKIKQTLQNTKARIITLIVCATLINSAGAQPVIPATADTFFYASNSPIQGFNTAMIGYGYPGSSATLGEIIASSYYDGTSSAAVYVKDLCGFTIASASLLGSIASVPDIIIGTNTTAVLPLPDYKIATAYVNGSGNVEIDFFDVFDPGCLTPAISPVSASSYVIITGYKPATVHLDVIAQASNTGSTGLPICDNFMITWDDFTAPTHPVVYAAEYGLNSMTLVAGPQQISPMGVDGYAPDVAGVQRKGGGRDLALVTYADFASGNTLYYREWDATASSLGTNTVIDNGAGSSSITVPRIDAWDDWNYNDPANAYSVYKVVAQVASTSTGYSEVRTYDNYLVPGYSLPYYASSGVIDIASLYLYIPPYNDYAPTVAFGIQQNFEVMHYMEYPPSPGDVLFMEPLPWNNPTASGTIYCWVNSLSVGGLPFPTDAYGTYASAVSAAANEPQAGVNSVYAWAFYNGSNYEVYYKAPRFSYGFKQAPTVVNNVTEQGWQLYPNPANNQLVVSQAAGSAATTYSVIDMAGRTVAQGALNAAQTDIDVRRLLPGAYVLQVNKCDGSAGQAMFVKE